MIRVLTLEVLVDRPSPAWKQGPAVKRAHWLHKNLNSRVLDYWMQGSGCTWLTTRSECRPLRRLSDKVHNECKEHLGFAPTFPSYKHSYQQRFDVHHRPTPSWVWELPGH